MSTAETIEVPHLGGSTIGYKFGTARTTPRSPTLVMVNSFTTSVELYRPQFADAALERDSQPARLRAVRPRPDPRAYAHFTYWDTRIANLQALEALGIPQAFVAGHVAGRMGRRPHGHARA